MLASAASASCIQEVFPVGGSQTQDQVSASPTAMMSMIKAVPASTKVVYQRKRPQMSYLPEFEEPDTKGMRGFYLSGALFFLLSALLFIFIGM